MSMEAPPSFHASTEDSKASLPPGYDGGPSTLPHLTERVFTLETSKNLPWAFLKVQSRGGNAARIPRFVQGELITGTVELSLKKTDHIESVTVEVQGEYLAVGQEPIRFLTREITLWSTSMGHPGAAGSNGPGTPKLKGNYAWPFSISLPDTVTVSAVEKGPTSEYLLPPSFSERASPCYLEYKVVVIFHRGRLRIDNVLSTSFAYLPRSCPPPLSALRQLSYREDTPLLGPKIDPEGWENLGTKSVIGTVFGSRTVEVACLSSLAKPLCYTRGTSIPFFLTLSCTDRQALDLLAGRGSLVVSLVRILRIGADTTDESKVARSDKKFVTNVGKGIYWSSEDGNPEAETRNLIGEIPLAADLKPSFIFPRVAIKYQVTLVLTAPGFIVASDDSISDHDPSKATFSCEVEIATAFAPGPIPRSKIPETVHDEHSTDYNVTIGLLTGANQRFLHHHTLLS